MFLFTLRFLHFFFSWDEFEIYMSSELKILLATYSRLHRHLLQMKKNQLVLGKVIFTITDWFKTLIWFV